MGKSPGRWIKTVLFGKKHPKSNFPKNFKPDKKSAVKASVEDPAGNSPVISNPFQLTDGSVENVQFEKGASGNPSATDVLSPDNQVVDSQSSVVSGALSDAELRRQEQAATKAQAIFRGYLARRAFRALKGIIRLQALIRGHLVRRQAVATLRCMHVIVKFQELARGPKDAKLVYTGAESLFRSEKLAANAFVRKLLFLLPTAMPLSLQYDLSEPNAAWNWLERWSLYRFWEPPTRTKKISNTKPQKKQGSPQTVEPESGKSKRTIRKASTAANGDNSALTSFETDKPKRNPRKITNHQTESTQEQPQNELERVKRSLRKISSPAALANEEPEPETENPPPNNSVKMISDSAALEASEQEMVISSEKPTDSDVIVDKLVLPEAPSRAVAIDDSVNVPFETPPVVETNCSENGENIENSPTLNNGLVSKEEQNGKETQKIRKRRSLPTKQEYPENAAQNTPTLPSYMAATQSAKAKLRAQGSSTIVEDGAEYGNARRHSLPASSNGKLSSLSPRIQNPVQSNGQGGSKSNRSLMSSRDEKMLQPGWRR